jgi:hypothetical protein
MPLRLSASTPSKHLHSAGPLPAALDAAPDIHAVAQKYSYAFCDVSGAEGRAFGWGPVALRVTPAERRPGRPARGWLYPGRCAR